MAHNWRKLRRERGGCVSVHVLCVRCFLLSVLSKPNLIQIVINHTQNSTIQSFVPWYFYFPLLSYLCSMVYQNYILNTLNFMVHLCVFCTFNFNLRQHLNSSSTVYGPLTNMILQNKPVSLNRLH